jgi:hypothetical protein
MFFNDHEQVIDLAGTSADVAARVEEVRTWLAGVCWIGALYDEVRWNSPTEPTWEMGPRGRELFPQLRYADVAINTSSPFWYTDGELLPPQCPNCAVRYDQETYLYKTLEEWSAGEPIGICANCGFIGLFGDWDIKNSPLGGTLAVLVYVDTHVISGDEYSDVLARELRTGLGGRWVNTSRHV